MKKLLLLLVLIVGIIYGEDVDNEKVKFDFNYFPDTVKVIDGDTIHVDVNISGCPDVLCKDLPIRISGIDTAEIHTTNPIEKQWAKLAKLEMEKFVNRDFYIYNCSRDKFFRVDCSLMDADQLDYAQYMKDIKLAIPYQGEKKTYDWTKHKR